MSQTTATNRGPRGWDRLVAQLNAAPDAPTFHRGMLDLQCKIVAAEYGTLWVAGAPGEATPIEFWPDPATKLPSDSPLMSIMGQAAKQGFERGVSHVLKLEAETNDQAAELGAHVFVTVFRVRGQVAALTTVVAECRDTQVLQSTMPLRELAAGLYDGFAARLESAQRESDTQRIRQALALLAVSQEAVGFTGSALNIVNELARQLSCTRVSMGWIRGRGVRLIAMSDTEHLKRHSEQVALLELAMAECLDQQQPIAYPIPEKAEPLIQQAVVHAHRKLTNQPNQSVLSLPLRHRDEWIGVVTLERTEPFDPGLIQYLQLIADVVAPQLDDRRQGDRPLPGHVWHSVEKTSAYLVGPKHVAWKLGAIGVMLLLLVLMFGTWEHRVTAPFVFEAYSRRILPAPFEGRIKQVFVEPGKMVKAGQLLAQLDTTELDLQLVEAQKKARLAFLEKAQKLAENKQAEVQQAQASLEQVNAQIALLEYQIEQATLKAPVDGAVVAGSWNDKVGNVIKQGDQMFEIAPLNDLVALLHVNETDIDQIDAAKVQTGRLATRSVPEKSFEIKTWRVVPAASPVNGVNSFEVRARLDEPADWLRPGMEGVAKVDAGRKPLYWILTHRIANVIRLWLWW